MGVAGLGVGVGAGVGARVGVGVGVGDGVTVGLGVCVGRGVAVGVEMLDVGDAVRAATGVLGGVGVVAPMRANRPKTSAHRLKIRAKCDANNFRVWLKGSFVFIMWFCDFLFLTTKFGRAVRRRLSHLKFRNNLPRPPRADRASFPSARLARCG